jgi:deoxyribonucleoside regulator
MVQIRDIEREIIRLFRLKRVVIAPTFSEDYEIRLRETCKMAVDDLCNGLGPNDILGVGWGMTMEYLATVFSSAALNKSKCSKVVMIEGSIGSDTNSVRSGTIVDKIAVFFSADGYLLPSPLVLDSEETARALKEDTHIKYIMEYAKNARACVFAIGVASHDSVLLRHGAYSKDMYDEILRRGAVGDILGYCFDINGRQVMPQIDKSIMSISLSDLKKIQLRIGIAVGEHKIKAIIGALRGGYINVLYTDSLTAREVVNIMHLS